MTALLGATLAAGLLLCGAPWLWPPRAEGEATRRAGLLSRMLAEAGLAAVRPRVLVVVMAALALAAASVVWLASAIPALAVLAAMAAAASPIVLLRSRRVRLRRLRRQLWPDICDLLIASIRVGLSLPDAVAGLSESAPSMMRPAFAVFAQDLRVTGRFEASLDRLKRSLADPIADRIIETLRMARQVGGTELSGVLRALSVSVRADAALRGEVEARQS